MRLQSRPLDVAGRVDDRVRPAEILVAQVVDDPGDAPDVRRDPLTGGEPTDALISRDGGRCEFVRADVASGKVCEQLVDLAVTNYGRLAVLVNNAVLAGPHSKPLIDTLDSDWDAMMAVNLRGPFMLCRAAY